MKNWGSYGSYKIDAKNKHESHSPNYYANGYNLNNIRRIQSALTVNQEYTQKASQESLKGSQECTQRKSRVHSQKVKSTLKASQKSLKESQECTHRKSIMPQCSTEAHRQYSKQSEDQ